MRYATIPVNSASANVSFYTKNSKMPNEQMSDMLRLKSLWYIRNSTYKCKAVPLQAWSGPEDSRKLSFPDFMTTAQDGGMFVSLTHRPPLPPENASGTHFC